jgi:hypothetical protein
MAQEHQLQGQLTDVSQGLTALRTAVGKPTPDGPAAFPVTYQPLPDARGAALPSVSAVLIDCSGKAAAELLATPWKPNERPPHDGLAGEVLQADTLVLPVDATTPTDQLDAYFESFGIFLRALEVQRGRRLEVAGLPVFLVLTKCDLLAKPTDTPIDWIERIEEHKRVVNEQFRAYLARDGEKGAPAFGSVDVHCWATAGRHPALAGAAKSRESYGVAELFRQCVQQATAYRRRQQRSGRRLRWTVVVAAALAVVMAGLALAQFLRGDRVRSELELRVQNFRDLYDGWPNVADRFNKPAPELNRRLDRLENLRKDPGFTALSSADREFVQDRIGELHDYLDLLAKVPPPRVLMDLRALDDLRKLRADIEQLPVSEDWANTDAGRRRAERLDDLDALKSAILTAQSRFRKGVTSADKLLTFSDFTAGPEALNDWLSEAQQLLLKDDPRTAFPAADHIPGSTTLTYGTVLAFAEVMRESLEWDSRRGKVAGIRDAVVALGLGKIEGLQPTLVIPRDFTLEAAKTRAEELAKSYPRFAADFTSEGLPPRLRQLILREALRSYENLLRPVREVVAQKIGSDDRWDELRRWADKPDSLDEWRFLVKALTPLLGGPPRDPVKELAAFLREPAFALRPTQLVLEVSDDSESVAQPPFNAVLTLEYKIKDGDKTTLTFALDNTKTRENRTNRLTRYFFNRKTGNSILYEPGGDLTATVPAAEGGRLVWKNPQASRVYQIERLSLPPILVSSGKPESGVRLLCQDPPDGLPRWPDLLQKPAR